LDKQTIKFNLKTIISPKKKSLKEMINELIYFKDLFVTLAWRDFKVRYAQTSIGIFWAIIQPLITLLLLSIVFGRFIGIETTVPHILFTVAGTSLWTYFSYVLTNSGNSIIASQNMVKKIYFPRIIIPISKSVVGFIDFFISLIIMVLLMIFYNYLPSSNIIFAPIFFIFCVISALGIGIWISALTVRYRDFQHIVPFIIQIGIYVTPVAYPAEFAVKNLPSWAASIYYLNPMAGVLQGFRWSLFGGEFPSSLIYISFVSLIILFISGIIYFNNIDDKIADLV
tara:strand:+ start:274 stop:1122 length:849 start_codon:yes stop_codon:yes gene_type:complete